MIFSTLILGLVFLEENTSISQSVDFSYESTSLSHNLDTFFYVGTTSVSRREIEDFCSMLKKIDADLFYKRLDVALQDLTKENLADLYYYASDLIGHDFDSLQPLDMSKAYDALVKNFKDYTSSSSSSSSSSSQSEKTDKTLKYRRFICVSYPCPNYDKLEQIKSFVDKLSEDKSFWEYCRFYFDYSDIPVRDDLYNEINSFIKSNEGLETLYEVAYCPITKFVFKVIAIDDEIIEEPCLNQEFICKGIYKIHAEVVEKISNKYYQNKVHFITFKPDVLS